MKSISPRRDFFKKLAILPFMTQGIDKTLLSPRTQNTDSHRLKISLNAFSFNDPLLNGSMDLDVLLDFCGALGFDAVDITAYYFPGYPEVPADEYLYHIKRKAFSLGMEISGTGVRNDFTEPDEGKRKESVALVKRWIEAAEKIGAPVIRIFAGNQNPEGYSRDQILQWMIQDIRACVDYGKNHGVVVAIQNHNDFILTADHALEIIQKIDSEWFGLMLDIGSYRKGDPYEEIARTANHAVNWQIKEKVFLKGAEVPTDLDKLIAIIKASDYKGYLPIETLGAGDPKEKVTALYHKLVKALG